MFKSLTEVWEFLKKIGLTDLKLQIAMPLHPILGTKGPEKFAEDILNSADIPSEISKQGIAAAGQFLNRFDYDFARKVLMEAAQKAPK